MGDHEEREAEESGYEDFFKSDHEIDTHVSSDLQAAYERGLEQARQDSEEAEYEIWLETHSRD